MMTTKRICVEAFGFLCLLMIVCGIYSFAVTGIVQWLFPSQANGSLIIREGKTVGSELIAQPFSAEQSLWGRAETYDYQMDDQGRLITAGVPANMNLLSSAYQQIISDRESKFTEFVSSPKKDIPLDLLTGSGSGMDPEISVAAANWQIERLVKTTGMSYGDIQNLIHENTKGKFLGLFGEKRVNVLNVNLAIRDWLDENQGDQVK